MTFGRIRHMVFGALIAVIAMLSSPLTMAEDVDQRWSVSGKVGTVSNYVARGLTQTWGRPALQAEIEAEHDSGFYTGLFGSNVSRNQFPGGGVETTFWLGYEHELRKDTTLAIEGIYFAYPGANLSKGTCSPLPSCPAQTFNTFEGRIVATWDWLSARYAYSFTDYFGASAASGYTAGTRGTSYTEVNANLKLPTDDSWQLTLHAGYTHYNAQYAAPSSGETNNPNYADWKVGVAKAVKDSTGAWRFALDYTRASNAAFYDNTRSLSNSSVRNLGGPNLAFSVERKF